MADISGTAGNDTLLGTPDSDSIDAGLGNDLVFGNAGNDTLAVNGSDTIHGGTGDDVFNLPEDQAVTSVLFGDEGRDTYIFPTASLGEGPYRGFPRDTIIADFATGPDGDLLDLRLGGAQFYSYFMMQDGADVRIIANFADKYPGDLQPILTLKNTTVEALDAAQFTNGLPQRLEGVILGFGGNDTLVGTADNDSILSQSGNDLVASLAGDDTVFSGNGNDTIRGGDGNDSINGENENDLIDGGPGNDSLEGDLSPFYGSGSDTVLGGLGNDTLFVLSGPDYLDGGPGNDSFNATFGRGTMIGGSGDDTFAGVGGGSISPDTQDYFGSYRITTGAGHDRLILDSGDVGWVDFVTDFQTGPNGDVLDLTQRFTTGGDPFAEGLIRLAQTGTAVNVQISEQMEPEEPVYWRTLVQFENTSVNQFTAENFGGFNPRATPVGTSNNDLITGTENGDTLSGYGGNDTLLGNGGDDRLRGGIDNDSLTGGAGNDDLGGNGGNDTVDGGDGSDLVVGAAGNDNVRGGAQADLVYGQDGDDTVSGGLDNDKVFGDVGQDLLFGNEGNDSLFGGAGDDRLYGGDGNDRLSGGSGNDTMDGQAGDDTLTGGTGADLFIVTNGGHDLVADFTLGEDRLDLRAIGLSGETATLAAATSVSGGTMISIGGTSILLAGVSLTQLQTVDFVV